MMVKISAIFCHLNYRLYFSDNKKFYVTTYKCIFAFSVFLPLAVYLKKAFQVFEEKKNVMKYLFLSKLRWSGKYF